MYGALRVIDPPDVEPVSVELARKHCRIDADYDDDLLEVYVATARDQAETYLNRALITQKLRFDITNSPPPTASPLVPQSFIVFPLNWPPLIRRPIALPRAPCQAIEEVAWGNIDDDLQVADPKLYTANLHAQPALVLIEPTLAPLYPAMAVAFTFIAGYGDEPDAIPAPIRHAVLVLVAHLYENRGDVAADMPEAAWRLLTPYRLWTFSA